MIYLTYLKKISLGKIMFLVVEAYKEYLKGRHSSGATGRAGAALRELGRVHHFPLSDIGRQNLAIAKKYIPHKLVNVTN